MYFLLDTYIIAETTAVILNGAKTFFTKGTITFINGAVILLNNNLKNPQD